MALVLSAVVVVLSGVLWHGLGLNFCGLFLVCSTMFMVFVFCGVCLVLDNYVHGLVLILRLWSYLRHCHCHTRTVFFD